jgi:hypothetical protein
MAHVYIAEIRDIEARPEVIWDILTDYRDGHPHILPSVFGPLTVEQGGRGAGTVMRFDMRVMGTIRHFHQSVSTPEPGRILVESDVDGPNRTSFTLTALGDGSRTRVEIASELETPPGPFGAIAASMTRRLIPPIYREELSKLAALAAERNA